MLRVAHLALPNVAPCALPEWDLSRKMFASFVYRFVLPRLVDWERM